MVAAAGEPGTLSPSVGAACFVAVLAGVIALAPLTRDINLIGLTGIDRGPQALTERAHAVLRNLGYADPATDEAVGYATDIDYLQHIDEHDRSATRWLALRSPQPPALLFWYRQSPRRLAPIGGAMRGHARESTADALGDDFVDARSGRPLGQLPGRADADRNTRTIERPRGSRLGAVVRGSRSSGRTLRAGGAAFDPPTFADARAAWTGKYPDRPDVPLRIEAAAALGKPVYFEMIAPWTRVQNEDPAPANTSGERVGVLLRTAVAPVALTLSMFLALRNLRVGRGDRRGAMRVSLFVLFAGAVSVALATGDLQVLSRGPAVLLLTPAVVWVLYIALEPHSAGSGRTS